MLRIWDIHVHFPRNFQQPDAVGQANVDHLAERLRETHVAKASLLCGGRFGLSHERCLELAAKHDDLFVPHAVVDPQETSYERVHELKEMGFRGLKIIGTRREYDDRDYFPTYRAAEELDMPILFHCGILGGGVDLLARHPRRDPEAAQRMREMDANAERARAELAEAERQGRPPPPRIGGPRETSATYMRPFHLESIANRFPQLRIIGAHLGNQGNYEYAASVARWRHNVSFDMSGGETIERHAVERGLIGKEIGFEKLIFGSDCGMDEIQEHIDRFHAIYEQLGLSEDQKERLWWRNGAEIYGLEEPVFAEE